VYIFFLLNCCNNKKKRKKKHGRKKEGRGIILNMKWINLLVLQFIVTPDLMFL